MKNNVAYESLKDRIESIPNDQIKVCGIPFSIYLQECEYLHDRSLKDIELLKVCGISKDTLDDLSTRIELCRFMYLQWKSLSKEKGSNQKKWEALSPQAFELRDHLTHSFLYAFRNNPPLISTLKNLKKGNSQPVLIQSLKDLSELGLKHLKLLEAINLTKETLITASELSYSMSELLAAYHSELGSSNKAKERYLKTFTYTKELVDEIRLAGKFVFWKDKKRLRDYASAHVRNKNKKYLKRKNTSV